MTHLNMVSIAVLVIVLFACLMICIKTRRAIQDADGLGSVNNGPSDDGEELVAEFGTAEDDVADDGEEPPVEWPDERDVMSMFEGADEGAYDNEAEEDADV
jgi:hypothetical protein